MIMDVGVPKIKLKTPSLKALSKLLLYAHAKSIQVDIRGK
jgi:hypothetical protein